MNRISYCLIAAVLAVGLAGTSYAPPIQAQTATEKGAQTKTDKGAQTKEERKAAREAKRKARDERKTARKAKAVECRAQAKQQKLRGDERRTFVRTCVKG